MSSTLQIGSASARAGQIVYGALDAVELPSGGMDQFPIIIAQGRSDGPVLWITASIHGAEYTGIPVIHQLITPQLVAAMHGTIVAVPTLNPAGLRTAQRIGYYMGGQDPNRLFPAYTKRSAAPSDVPLPIIEVAYQRLFDHIRASASYLIDLHNYSLGALSFAFRDPVYYHSARERVAAEQLQATVGKMLTAFGHTIINEYASAEYIRMNLHRSVSGAALNTGHIPSFTAELGGYMTVDHAMVKAAVSGVRNVMRWAGMLNDAPESITGIKVLAPDYAIRRTQHPFSPHSGILHYYVQAGDTVTAGQPIARITDIYGRPLGDDDGRVSTQLDGTVLGVSLGAMCYQNEPLLSLAIHDDGESVLPFPG